MPAGSSPPQPPASPPSFAQPVTVPPVVVLPAPDRWTTWVADEKQRVEDIHRDLHMAMLMAVVVLALGGAIYLSFWSTP